MRRLAVVLAALLGLTACSHPSEEPAGGVPSADVVAAVRPDPTLNSRLPAKIRVSRTLVFGTTEQPGTAQLPYFGTVDGKPLGLHLDLADAVAKVLGLTAERAIGTFPTIVPGVQNGKYDVGLANLGVTAERSKVVDFATYLTDGQSFLASSRVKLDKVTKLTDICGLTVATSPGSTFQQLLENGKDECRKAGKQPYVVQYFSTTAPIILGLANGKVDVEFGPTLSLRYDASKIPGTKFLGQLTSTPVGLVTAKGSPLAPLLRDAINTLISTGVYGKIVAKWDLKSSAITRSQLNPTPNL